MMSHMQEWLARAANELGVRIKVGHVARLTDGTSLPTKALFPDLGSAAGTIVLSSDDVIEASIRRDLIAQGFSISAFSEPLANEEFDVASYAEMFSEWGWTGDNDQKPEWMR